MTLKAALRARQLLAGTFLKTPSPIVCEVLGRSDLDLICIDAEHAPFDRREIDACVMALRAAGKPSLVRVPTAAPEHILNALDCGATGILAPHIVTGEDAARLAANAYYGSGRGYAGSSRSAGYMTRSMAEHIRLSAAETVVVAQIEDREALGHLGDIFAEPRIDAFFVGRADLTVSLGASGPDAPEVIEAVEEICRRGREVGAAIGMFTANLAELPKWQKSGASLFLLSSDHGFLLSGASALMAQVRNAV
jgi:2-keto-3-deoxy-L-rhamnonate aldolase RhmA